MGYVTINGQQFHLEQSLKMGKDAFVKAHKATVRDTVKVWEQLESMATPKTTKTVKSNKD